MQRILLLAGTILLLAGLLLGTILESFPSPEVAADSHVAGVQHGMLLMIMALSWKFSRLERFENVCAILNIAGLYGIWGAFLTGAILGDPYPSASTITHFMFVTFSGSLIVGVGWFLFGVYRGKNSENEA